ncbi:MAG: GNAT family N-acetyltransferase [Pirellula sp.]
MNTDWIEWVRWCHADQSLDLIQATIYNLMELTQRSRLAQPVIVSNVTDLEYTAAGYIAIHPGALGAIGSLRCQADNELSVSDRRPVEITMLERVLRTLCQSAMEQGAEIVQAISPLTVSCDDRTDTITFEPFTSVREAALSLVLQPIAKLVQMEWRIRNPPTGQGTLGSTLGSPSCSTDAAQLRFVPFDCIDESQWHQVLDDSYIDTLDVPELNGRRGTASTLEGYASLIHGHPRTWWVVQEKDQHVGCLLLSPVDEGHVELTYLGLVRSKRGKGYSHGFLRFVEDWCEANDVTRVTVAVDIRNVPALRLYQHWGFQVKGFVQAWVNGPHHYPHLI